MANPPSFSIQRLRDKPPFRKGHILHVFNFFRWHVIVGLLVPLAAGGIFCACNNAAAPTVTYIDALFMCTSALTLTGLSVTEVGPMSFGQQFILYVLFQFGSIQSVSMLTLLVRRAAFNKRFSESQVYFPTRKNTSIRRDIDAAETVLIDPREMAGPAESKVDAQADKNEDSTRKQVGGQQQPIAGRGGFPNPVQLAYQRAWDQLRKRFRSNTRPSSKTSSFKRKKRPATQEEVKEGMRQQGYKQIGENLWQRNSDIRDLNREQHVKLNRLEISAMTYILYAVFAYWILSQLFAVIMWAPYFSAGYYSESFVKPVSRTWFAVFQAASMANNCGLSLVDTSLTTFQTTYIMLIPAVLLVLSGDIAFPIALRMFIWLFNYCLPDRSTLKRLGAFVLGHPRRVYIYMFPPYETAALVVAVILLVSVDWVAFFVLNIGYLDNPVYAMPDGSSAIGSLVQSVSVRSAGFYILNLWQTAPSLHVLYIFMMIFAVYPVAMAIRATNVYEAKALGIRYDEDNLSTGLRHLRQEEGYVGLHLKEQLSYDVWFIILATFLICIVERAALETPATSSYGQFSVFDVIFEVCSAYANVGLSIGSPSSNTSTSGDFRHLSKLMLCATMIRGRTRGLPISLDRSIMTPRDLDDIGDSPERCSAGDEQRAASEADQQE